MSLKSKIFMVGMIIRGVATFGLALYTFVNFAKWMIEDSRINTEE